MNTESTNNKNNTSSSENENLSIMEHVSIIKDLLYWIQQYLTIYDIEKNDIYL